MDLFKEDAMRTLYPSMIILAVSLLLSACTSTSQSPGQVASNIINRETLTFTSPNHYPAKKPEAVAIYSKEKTPTAYRIIGSTTVSKFNLLGMQRQENTIHVMMKKLAASVGGDGLIDVNNNKYEMQAKIIAFEKIRF